MKDVTAHIMNGNIRGLSMSRDNVVNAPPGDIGAYRALVRYLNQPNADWVTAARSTIPALIISLLASTGDACTHHLTTPNPVEPTIFSVA